MGGRARALDRAQLIERRVELPLLLVVGGGAGTAERHCHEPAQGSEQCRSHD
jgi:hypothetical protein